MLFGVFLCFSQQVISQTSCAEGVIVYGFVIYILIYTVHTFVLRLGGCKVLMQIVFKVFNINYLLLSF